MTGETDLNVLLKNMQPVLNNGEYVFCTLPADKEFSKLQPLAFIGEAEGNSLVVPRVLAEQYKIPFSTSFCCITLNVHSSLQAVGLTAAISSALAEIGISANIIAGFYHDHLFVPAADAETALAVLKKLSTA